jgi:tetratricopeptide (TPR) repeat protein
LKTQQPDKAAASLTACLGLRRNMAWLYLLRASAWSEMGQLTRAEDDFAAALKESLDDTARFGLLVNRGVLRMRQGRIDSARADLEQAIALRPQQYQGYVNLAQTLLKANQLQEALKQLDVAIGVEPALASLYRTRARLHLLLDERAAAVADLDKAIKLEPKTASAVLAGDHLERGGLLRAGHDFEGALQACNAALLLRPEDARGYRLQAEVLLELKRLPAALLSLDSCLKYGPPDAGAFRARAAVRMQVGQYAGAQTDFTRALEIKVDAATYAARGWSYLVADAPKLALPDFDEAIRLAPEQGDTYGGRGYARVLLGKCVLALNDADESLKRGPRSPRLCYNAGRIYAQASTQADPLRNAATVEQWQQHAVHLLVLALDMQPAVEAARFWHSVVKVDTAMNPLRHNQAFKQLAARYPATQTSALPKIVFQAKQ